MKPNEPRTVYPLLGILCAGAGTWALLARGADGSTLLLWVLLLLAANVFFTAGVVCGTKEQTIRVPDRRAAHRREEPTMVEAKIYRVPILPILLAAVATVAVAAYTRSALDSLLTLFTWGALGYPLARCILRRRPFAFSLQIGLISSVVFTILAGIIHVFKVSPDHSFQLRYAFELATRAVTERLTPIMQTAKDLLGTQPINLEMESEFSLLLKTAPSEVLAASVTYTFLIYLPALFAILMLAALCIIWWLSKEALKRDARVEVKHMERLDGYTPSRAVTIVYFVSYLVSLIGADSIGVRLLGLNLNTVTSAVLAFAGYSLVLFAINTRATSKPMRIGLSVLTLLLGLDSCGYQLLILAGLFSTGNLRNAMGGGTLK